MSVTVERLLELVDDKTSVEDLVTYFGSGAPAGSRPEYTGSRFEGLAGGGDRPETAGRISADDLVAVEMLSVHVPGPTALELLEGRLGHEVSIQLQAISLTATIGSAEAADLLRKDGPAWNAWDLLKSADGIGWVIANKLLARKRPRLLPVYDRVVACALGRPEHLWDELNLAFASQDGRLSNILANAQAEAAVPAHVTPLRVLDVIVWMRHRRGHLSSKCAGLAHEAGV